MSDLLTRHEMHAEMVRRIDAAGGVVAWCRKTGLSHTPVSLAKNGHREITEAIANACGFILEPGYRPMRSNRQ